ncbi:MAG: AAA family ATPase [Bacteroidales bacterium]|nr:AAA family ATPase [Bacteroidales bacterium]
MGRFIDIGNKDFSDAVADTYVDKTKLIPAINSTLRTQARMSCVTRCRRFGKSMAASMLCAYYDKSCSSRELFRGLAVESDPSFQHHLNRYRVIFLSMSDLISKYGHDPEIIEKIQADIMEDVRRVFPEVELEPRDDLMDLLLSIATEKGEEFVMVIDEWDAICREFADESVMDRYVNWLRRLFKGVNTSRVFAGAYITGILPIKKYNTESALNNFCEYTMTAPGRLAPHFGFTAKEVKALCDQRGFSFEEMERWYDGYSIGTEPSMFNPNSVMLALRNGVCSNYWSATGAFDRVATYIQMNFQGLKDDIIAMLAGESRPVRYVRFGNDINIIKSKDDVLTVLIHLGYLSYNPVTRTCRIPNLEVIKALEDSATTAPSRPTSAT